MRPDAVGKPVGLKKPFEMSETLLQRDRRVCIAAQQVAGGEIADRQRKAVVSVLHPELPLVVRSPNIIRPLGDGLRAAGARPPIPPSGLDQSFS